MVEVQDSFVISPTAEAILTKASLSSLLQVYGDDRKSTSLTVKNGSVFGKIHLREGRLIHAEHGELIGDPAFLKIADWEKPELIIVDRLRSEAHSVRQSLQNLLLEAARLRDEGQKDEAPGPAAAAQAQPGAKVNLRALLESLLKRPGTKGLLIFDYTNDQVLMTLGEVRSPDLLVEFYSSLVRVSKQLALIRRAERNLELSLGMGTEQHHLVLPLRARGVCVAHIGQPEPDSRALVSTLAQIAENFAT